MQRRNCNYWSVSQTSYRRNPYLGRKYSIVNISHLQYTNHCSCLHLDYGNSSETRVNQNMICLILLFNGTAYSYAVTLAKTQLLAFIRFQKYCYISSQIIQSSVLKSGHIMVGLYSPF